MLSPLSWTNIFVDVARLEMQSLKKKKNIVCGQSEKNLGPIFELKSSKVAVAF